MLIAALEAEVAEHIQRFAECRDSDGHRLVVRNGHHRKRKLDTGVGSIEVAVPRVDDGRLAADGSREHFSSKILPPYLRKTPNLEALIPWLYLKGISTSDFDECLKMLVGDGASSVSPTTVVRLKEIWSQEFTAWASRSLTGKRYVYFWADGVYFNIRLEGERQCILVIVAATEDGTKELLAVHDGVRESEQSWTEVLEDLKARGLDLAPKLAVGDGALGFWKALDKVFPTTARQRCWKHKAGNVLNCLPKTLQPSALAALHQIWMADTRENAIKAFDKFVATYQAKYPKAVLCLEKDRDDLLAFYDFPAEHWKHLRTTNPIESTFATVRLRTKVTKGPGSKAAGLAMAFKLIESAQNRWRSVNAPKLVALVRAGATFRNGVLVERDQAAA